MILQKISIRTEHRTKRGTTVLAAVWAIAVGAMIAASVQLFGWRQATNSRQVVERVQARWAARAGVENTIAVLADYTETPAPDDAFAIVREMEFVSAGAVGGATYNIRHWRDRRHWAGPLDEHSRMNVNNMSEGQLMLLENMTPDVAASIVEWRVETDEPNLLAAGRDYYRALEVPYEPRKAPYRSVAELELVAGIWPEYLRGEDWNMNHQLDPNENDRELSWPMDRGDGVLDAGWSQYLTAHSIDAGATGTGLPRIWLRGAIVEDLVARLNVDELQALKLIDFGKSLNNRLESLAVIELSQINATGSVSENPPQQQQQGDPGGRGPGRQQASPPADALPPLTDEQLRAIFRETSVVHPATRPFGRMNINTVPEDFLRDMLGEEGLADEVIYLRNSRSEGITSLLDLRDIPGLDDQQWLQLAQRFDVQSNIYTVVSRGQSQATGTTVEIIAVVDRSTVPIRIIEYREQ